MSHFNRRQMLGAAMAAAGVAAATEDLAAAESKEDLPTFRYAMEASKARVTEGGSAKEATIKQLPISKGLAGVSMRIKSGRYPRAPLARERGRVGLRHQGAGSHDRDRAREHFGDQRFRSRRRLVLPPRPRPYAPELSARRNATSSWSSMTAHSPSSAPSAALTGWDIRHPPCSRKARLARVGLCEVPEGGAVHLNGRIRDQGNPAASSEDVRSARPRHIAIRSGPDQPTPLRGRGAPGHG